MRIKAVSALAAFAVVPAFVFASQIAVWDGDFSESALSQTSCTLVLNGNSVSDDGSTVTIDQASAGIDLNLASAIPSNGGGMTVLVKYSGLAAESGGKTKVIATSCNDSEYAKDRTGVDLQQDGILYGMWYGGTQWNDYGSHAGTIAESGCFAFTYKPGAGTYLHVASEGGVFSGTAAWGNSGLHSSNDSIYGATVGGMRSGTVNQNWQAASGMKVYAVAVFDSVLTTEELNNCVTVSIPVSGNTTVSAINGLIESSAINGFTQAAAVTLDDGATVTLDADGFSMPVRFVSSGSVVFAAASAPADDYFDSVDFSGVSGDVVRAWGKPTLTLASGDNATWSGAGWLVNGASVSAPLAYDAEIVVDGSATLTIDTTVALETLTVSGSENAVLTLALGDSGSFVANGSVTVAGGVLKQGTANVLGSTPTVNVRSGATLDLDGFAFGETTEVVIAGSGAGDWRWALTSSTDRDTANYVYRVRLADDATVGGDNTLRFQGIPGYEYATNLDGHKMTKTGNGDLVWRTVRSHGNGEVEVSGGRWVFEQWTSLDGSETIDRRTTVTLDGESSMVNSAGRRLWIDTLNWSDGATVTTDSSGYFGIASALNGGGSTAVIRFNDGAVATLERDLTITEFLVAADAVTFRKADGVESVAVNVGASFTAGGTVTVGDGVTLNLGTSRPAGTLDVADGGALTVKLAASGDAPSFSVASRPANITLYDESGAVVENPSIVYDDEKGTVTLSPASVWTAKTGTSFDAADNWSSGAAPANGASALVSVSGDTALTVSGAYVLDTLTISGSGAVSFSGSGSITAGTVIVQNGATLVRTGGQALGAGAISVASGSVVRIDGTNADYVEGTTISGAGAVESYGNVTMGVNNSFTGGFTVRTGTLSAASDTTTPYGAFSVYGYRVTVEDGACVDIAQSKDNGYALAISGKGVLQSDGTYSGAVKNTGVAMGTKARQTMALTLNGDALVDVSTGWGLVSTLYAYEIPLVLNGHTLTMRGAGTVPMTHVNASSTSGTLVLDGATLQTFGDYANNFSGVDVVVKNSASIDFTTAPSAIGSLTIEPSASGTAAVAWNLPEGFVPTIATGAIAPAGLSVGDTLTVFSAPAGTTLTEETVSVEAGGRYAAAISGNTVTLSVKALAPFLHYDFDDASATTFAGFKAQDSRFEVTGLSENYYLNYYTKFPPVTARNGKALEVLAEGDNEKMPWFDNNTAGVSPNHADELSVSALVKPFETDNAILWNLGEASGSGIALIAKDSSTVALVAWTDSGAGYEVVSVSGIENLAGRWHLATVVATANGTTLYVDGASASTDATIPSAIGQNGQFGSIHGNAKSYTRAGEKGFRIDDWRVYDAALTDEEVAALRRALYPAPFTVYMR